MQTIKLTLLEFNEGEYQGTKYSNIHARYNGKILKFKLDRIKVGNTSAWRNMIPSGRFFITINEEHSVF